MPLVGVAHRSAPGLASGFASEVARELAAHLARRLAHRFARRADGLPNGRGDVLLLAPVLCPGRRGERQQTGDESESPNLHGQLFSLIPETMRAAPASLPFRTSLMSDTVSCSSAIFDLKLSSRLCCAGALFGCVRSAARLSLMA